MVAAIDGESKHYAKTPDRYRRIRGLSGSDDFVADLGRAGGNHADILCGCTGKIEYPAPNERSAIIDANDDAAAVIAVGDLQACAEGKRAMSGSKTRGTHPFPGSSLGGSAVP